MPTNENAVANGLTATTLTAAGVTNPHALPRYAGFATFARLPRTEDLDRAPDIAIVGVPFDSGTTYRPGARLGPAAIRQASRILRPYNPHQNVYPWSDAVVADAGDFGCTPFSTKEAVFQIESQARTMITESTRVVAIGGDHTIALPLLRATAEVHGPVALVHFDAHLDTWDVIFGESIHHGSPFRRAQEEGLLLKEPLVHVGIRNSLQSHHDLDADRDLGFRIVSTEEISRTGTQAIVDDLQARLKGLPVYLSLDIDVIDPSHAPGTGTPEPGGLSSRETLEIIRGLSGLNIVGADVVEVSPPFDHAELTSLSASQIVYEFISLIENRAKDTRSASAYASSSLHPV